MNIFDSDDLLDVYIELGPNIATTPSDASPHAVFKNIHIRYIEKSPKIKSSNQFVQLYMCPFDQLF